jgi:site-specific DNA-methyltransferase (adenine-specific)
MPLLPDKSIDMILCDLPYGTTACKWDTIIPFEPLWEQYRRLIKNGRVIVLTSCQPFTSLLITSNIKQFKYCWIWEKPQGVDPFMSTIRPLNNYEDICVFGGDKLIYNPQKALGNPYVIHRDKSPRELGTTGTRLKPTMTANYGDRFPTRILRFNQERGFHETQKPVALFEYLIRTYTNEGDTVLDNCIGSGTTGIAAKNTGRNYIGIELNSEHACLARKRIEAETAQMRMFV